MKHADVQVILYEYICGELSASDRTMVELHLAACPSCAREIEELKDLVHLMRPVGPAPSDQRSQKFWDQLSLRIEQEIRSTPRAVRETSPLRWYEELFSYLSLRRRPLVAMGSAVATLAVAAVLWAVLSPRLPLASQVPTAENPATPVPVQTARYNPEVGDYLRRSKILLIGLSNMRLDDRQPIDLSTEQEVSRQLIHQARSLKQQPLDLSSAQLIEDVQKVLIDLANMKNRNDVPGVEIIRSGIHQENLLFKIRMAEARFDTVRTLSENDDGE